MPTPFFCHGCDKPTMSSSGVCDECENKPYCPKCDSVLIDIECQVGWSGRYDYDGGQPIEETFLFCEGCDKTYDAEEFI